MKRYIFVIAICFTFLNCSSTQNKTSNDGSSIEKAFKVEKSEDIAKIIRKKCVDCKKAEFPPVEFKVKEKTITVITYRKPNGENINYHFDTTSL